jgi:ribosome-binding protein aMBF1 (putative translation factor)
MTVYAGLHKMSCDMCGSLVKPKHTVTHRDNSKVDICDICYGRCLAYPKFNQGIESEDIKVDDYKGG